MTRGSREVVIHDGSAGLAALRADWRALSARVPGAAFYAQHDWYAAYLDHLEPAPDRVSFLELRGEGQCRGVLPVRWPDRARGPSGFSRLELPRRTGMDLTAPLLDQAERLADWWPVIRDALARRGLHGFVLHASGWLLTPGASTLDGAERWGIQRVQGHSCAFDCRLGHSALQARYSSRLEKILRKAHKALQQLGPLQVVTVMRGPAMSEAFDTFLRLEASGWKGASGSATALLFDDAPRRFLARLMLESGADFDPEVNLLMAGAQPLATQLCLRRGACLSVLKIAYDDALARYSPGSLLLDRVLARACDSGTQSVSLVTGQPWMTLWNPGSTPVADVWLFSHAPFAMLSRAWLGLRRLRDRVATEANAA
ncbi:MAG: GNAT family N-acetyltransferase [Thiotrichales bacterium]